MLRFLSLLMIAAVAPSPVSAAAQASPSDAAAPMSDADFAGEIQSVIGSANPAAALARLEALAARGGLTEQQTVTVAFMRISQLEGLDRAAEGIPLARQLLAKFPRSADAHLVMAGATFAESDFQATAQAIRQASELDPAVVNRIAVYELSIVFRWLKSQEKYDEATALARRLFDAGWDNGGPRFRSVLALDVVEEYLSNGDPVSASRYVPKITDPATFAKILSERRFDGVRPAARDWAGARIEKQWPIFLDRTRAEWLRSGTPDYASDYAAALALAGHNRTLVATFLPMFDRKLDPDEDLLWVFLVAPVSRALAGLGRWDEAFALFDRASSIWPPSFGANAINIDANRARYRLLKGDFAEAVRLYDRLDPQVKAAQKEVTPQTRASIEAYRLCALHRAGQKDVAVDARALAAAWTTREPYTVAWLHLCRGAPGDARATWLAALANPQVRTNAVSFIQVRDDSGADSAFAREMRAAEARLADDPVLRAAVLPYGERLGWTLLETAPREAVAQSR